MHVQDGVASGHLLHVGIVFLEEGDLEKAIFAFDLGLTFHPKHADLLCHRGIAYHQKGDLETAAESFEKALKIFPNHCISQLALAKLFMDRACFLGEYRSYSLARAYFRSVANNPCTIDPHIREEAVEGAMMDDTQLLQGWFATRRHLLNH